MPKNVPNLIKSINAQVQEAQQTQAQKKISQIIIKVLIVSDKTLKATRGEDKDTLFAEKQK